MLFGYIYNFFYIAFGIFYICTCERCYTREEFLIQVVQVGIFLMDWWVSNSALYFCCFVFLRFYVILFLVLQPMLIITLHSHASLIKDKLVLLEFI